MRRWKIGRPEYTGRPKSRSGDEMATATRVIGAFREVLVGFEVQVVLDRKLELAADGLQFHEADVAKLGATETKIAEAKGELAGGVEFHKEPGALCVRREKFDDGLEVQRLVPSVDGGALSAAVGLKLFDLCFREECHGEVSCVGSTLPPN